MEQIASNQDLKIKGQVIQRRIGEKIEVVCKDAFKTLSNDFWDGNPSDNIIQIMCGYNEKFNTPKDLPLCLAKCPLSFSIKFPVLDAGYPPVREPEGRLEIYQNQKIW